MPSISAKRIVFVVFPDVKLLDLAGPLQVFADASEISPGHYETRVVSVGGGFVGSDTVLPIATQAMAEVSTTSIDSVIVIGGPGAFAACKHKPLLKEVCTLASKARRVASVCNGAFVLAAAGLLAGKSAVTHWQSCQRLRDTYEDVNVVEDAIFIRDGKVRTSAGVTAGIDMCLDMVAEDMGRKAALSLARALVCYLIRPGGQSQFSEPLRQQSQNSSDKFEALHAWISENLDADLSVDTLAQHQRMSRRNFARLYRQTTGATPAKAVEAFRVEAACRLLEETDLPLTLISRQCGFHDDERLRRAMMRHRGVAPGGYRLRFGGQVGGVTDTRNGLRTARK
ncbi:MAG: DJ-1/PfpI family protein [Pseudomonadota bacterium]